MESSKAKEESLPRAKSRTGTCGRCSWGRLMLLQRTIWTLWTWTRHDLFSLFELNANHGFSSRVRQLQSENKSQCAFDVSLCPLSQSCI
ncbi:hypothetical protein GCG54_00015569 [Colletotrichum gloeosporioides]|uniref:Uncharacterized protein n=1 Tax=Colletotrichum gloeosporioides TaxID=474922 RepID=A0A8H4CXL1_COLGL|nr:uncharacterized protein GCG54_00015569 [Colletotrichum gloeosporioides]KAF3812020.1 hypothetical protein GCG54_00015569 [Colletotrichum gloeosporioides]